MARKRYNNASGSLGASLSSSGTTITFATAPPFATLTGSDYIALPLEPGAANFEIVWLTAYTALATTGTIVRGQEGTTGVSHANSAAWDCSPTVLDFPTGAFTSGNLLQANSSGQPTDSGIVASSVVTVSSGTPTAGQVPVFTGTGNQTTPGSASSSPIFTPRLDDSTLPRLSSANSPSLSSAWNTLNTARCNIVVGGTTEVIGFEAVSDGGYGSNVFIRDMTYALYHQPNLLSSTWRQTFVEYALAQRSTTSDPNPNGGFLPANFIANYITSTGTRSFLNAGHSALPEMDGIAFVVLALWVDFIETGETTVFASQETVIDSCLAALPRNPSNANGCVYSNPSAPSVDYGFTDGIQKTGNCAYGTALLAWAFRMLAQMNGETTATGKYTAQYLSTINDLRSLRQTAGYYAPSSANCSTLTDVWATALIVAEGLCTPAEQWASAVWLANAYTQGDISQYGRVRHLPFGQFWPNYSGTSGQGQDGGLWFTPLYDCLRAVALVNSDIAYRWAYEAAAEWGNDIAGYAANEAPLEWVSYGTAAGHAGEIEAAAFFARLCSGGAGFYEIESSGGSTTMPPDCVLIDETTIALAGASVGTGKTGELRLLDARGRVIWTASGISSPQIVTVQGAPSAGVSSFNSRTGAVAPASGDYTVSQVTGAAPLASPSLTGTPTAPTASSGNNSTQLATTAFVQAAVTGGGGGGGGIVAALQNGVINSGDLAASSISMSTSTGAITLTNAAGSPCYVASSGGVLTSVTFAGGSSTQTPGSLPASGDYCVYGIEIDTSGALHIVKGTDTATQLNTGKLIMANSPATTSGRMRIQDFALWNNSGTINFSDHTTTATQGTNWIDRRPWARGFHYRSPARTTNASGGNDYSTSTTTVAPIDSTNLSFRVETTTGLLRLTLVSFYSGNTALQFEWWVDGSAPEGNAAPVLNNVSQQAPFFYYETNVTPGSRLIQPAFSILGSGTATLITRSASPLYVTIDEVVRQTANNGTS